MSRVTEPSILVDLTSTTVKALLNLFADFKDLVLGYCREPKLIWKRLFLFFLHKKIWWLVVGAVWQVDIVVGFFSE